MALHEQPGATDEWYTPAYIFEAMGERFTLDPCAGPHWSPAAKRCEVQWRHSGLTAQWVGFVWLNPPFGARNGIVPWLDKFFAHGNGVALVPDRTSAPWWREYAPRADLVLFVSPKPKFIGADGEPGRSPAQGACLLAAGERGAQALRNAVVLGAIFKPERPQ